jgi:hypothetical protein
MGDNDCDKTRMMIDATLAGASIGGQGDSLGVLPLTAAGCGVAEDWIDTDLANNGLVMILADNRDPNSVMHLGTRERGCAGPAACPGVAAAELTLEILPEPATMLLLAGGACLTLLRRRR